MEKMRILAIDDNTVNLATLEQELKTKYEVIPMISGRRAIKYLYRENVDLILLDVEMPIMDGIETLKEIRAQENGVTVPVIFLTAKRIRRPLSMAQSSVSWIILPSPLIRKTYMSVLSVCLSVWVCYRWKKKNCMHVSWVR